MGGGYPFFEGHDFVVGEGIGFCNHGDQVDLSSACEGEGGTLEWRRLMNSMSRGLREWPVG